MASYFNLTLDTTAPSGLSITLNDSDIYTTTTAVTLAVSLSDEDTNGYQMKVWGTAAAAEERRSPNDDADPARSSSGARTFCFFHSENRQVPVLREINPDPIAEINPEDAKEKGVVNGQWVELENMYGAAKYKAKVSPIVRKGTVLAQDHGTGKARATNAARRPAMRSMSTLAPHGAPPLQRVLWGKASKQPTGKDAHFDPVPKCAKAAKGAGSTAPDP